ncbi:ammonium transporter [Sphingomonas koreensis]|nr:ammonium transporter [Sphingomonas koreensis]RSU69953.1 ammonium transporter [Sphingomonas koreensis]
MIPGIVWAAGAIGTALAATAARKAGLTDGDTVTRLVIGLNGLMVMWFGNRMPKNYVPSARARQVARVGGWSMALSGLAYTGFWAVAPIQTAVIGGSAAIILGIAVTVGYCLSLRSKANVA